MLFFLENKTHGVKPGFNVKGLVSTACVFVLHQRMVGMFKIFAFDDPRVKKRAYDRPCEALFIYVGTLSFEQYYYGVDGILQ